jgi:hypothetical protein
MAKELAPLSGLQDADRWSRFATIRSEPVADEDLYREAHAFRLAF